MRTIYLLHAKKSKNQQFKCGDEVWFHHPEKYGMVVTPNIKGRVTEVVPCNYYRVLHNTLEGTECTATLYGSMMVLGRPSPTHLLSQMFPDCTISSLGFNCIYCTWAARYNTDIYQTFVC